MGSSKANSDQVPFNPETQKTNFYQLADTVAIMEAEFTEDQIKAMIFGLEEEEIVEYPCNKEEEPKVAEAPTPTTQVPPPPSQAPVDTCDTPVTELPQVKNGDSSGKRRIPRSCPVPECGEKLVVNLWNHLFQTHKASGKYTGKYELYRDQSSIHITHFRSNADNELKEFLREAKRRVPTVTRRAPRRKLATVVEGGREGNGPKRRRWVELEEAIITAHFGLVEIRKTPSLEECQQFLSEFSNETLFIDRKKKEIQDKCRTIIKKCKHSYTPT